MLPTQEKMLRSFLGRLPPATAQQLAHAIEADKLFDGKGLPHEVILESLRPSLRHAAPEGRMLTPLRLFCQPFEDLLISAGGKAKLKGRIARESILPTWTWLSTELMPNEAQTYSTEVRTAIANQNIPVAYSLAADFWQTVSNAICKAFADEHDRSTARATLGDLAFADAEEMALMLGVGRRVLEIQQKLPRGTATLTEATIWSLREIYDALLQSNPDVAPYVTVITMSRLAKPWEALRLPLMITRKTQDTLLSSTDMGMAGELLFHDLEEYAFQIRAVRQPQFDVDMLLRNLLRFTELSSAVVKELEIRRDGRWGQNLLKDRVLVGEAMDAMMEKAPKEILGAMPMHKSGSYGSGPRVPNIEHMPDHADKTERALRYARLLVGCRHLAARASFGATHKDAVDEVERDLRVYNEDIMKLVRDPDEARRAKVEPFFHAAVDLTAILFSEEEADFLRRRARASLAA
ncbi:MAG TPA: hypothetical protein VGM36_04085 [Rhizomicrobium sp.]|jgi:hypothetical protein